jgi:hypothetical protein
MRQILYPANLPPEALLYPTNLPPEAMRVDPKPPYKFTGLYPTNLPPEAIRKNLYSCKFTAGGHDTLAKVA